ncbi:M56 family metallopeptidase [Telmatobacter sp. DSM 110680]|uniref:M56 family metallopeptidase n=1 Tax=Telmatobacter sp. DSM 110680 TaxID=3036704 RepID=A0AAU7DKN0_9BACT
MISSILVEAALRSVLLALAVWIGLRMLGVRNVLAQKGAWGLVLAGALVMPIVLPMAAHWTVLPANVRVVLPADPQTLLEELQARIQAKTSLEQKPAVAATAGEGATQVEQQAGSSVSEPVANRAASAPEPQSSSSDADVVAYRPQPPIQTESAAPQAVLPPRAGLSVTKVILLLYLAVAGIFLVRLAFGLLVALRLWRRANPISCELLAASDISVDLRCSAEVSSPVTICSAIVLPMDYSTWDSEKLRVVLAHERSHIRQKDFYLQLLAGAYAAVVWFSPLGWWLKRKLSDLAEAISDRAGLEEAADPTSYAQILLEFAAAPRPTLIGVAMARSGSVSRRIERLLNDVSFRQAFAGSRRALAAVLVVPVVLFAATALVRVQAAGQQSPVPPAPAAAPTAGVTAPASVPTPPAIAPVAPKSDVPEPAPVAGEPALAAPEEVPPLPAQAGTPAIVAPAAPATPEMLTLTPAPAAGPAHLTVLPPTPARGAMTLIAPRAPGQPSSLIVVRPGGRTLALIAPHAGYGEGRGYGVGQSATSESGTSSYSNNGKHSGYHYSYSSNGESYAIIRGDDMNHMSFSGDWIEGRRDELAKARKQAHGDFLWFVRDGKPYFVDDPSTLAQIEAMYKPMEALGAQQEALGKEQEALGKQQEELGRQQEKASVPTPDMSKEIAQIDEAMAKLKANQGKAMNEEQFAELQSKLGDLQGKLGEIQGRIGARQGEFGEQMGKLGAMQGELGAKQGRLGEEQGRIAQEADRMVKAIILESLKNGKAHPVQ